MKPQELDNLIDKYWDGNSSLEEEKQLKNRIHDESDIEGIYFNYLNRENIVPLNLEESVWNAINDNQNKPFLNKQTWWIAASIVLLLSLTSTLVVQKRQTLLEQEFALIEETLFHVSGELNHSTINEVLYQDDFIVIVAEN